MKNRELFVVSTAALIATTVCIYIMKRRKVQSAGKPPKTAPQLKVDNPGDQSEFPTSPTGDRELG